MSVLSPLQLGPQSGRKSKQKQRQNLSSCDSSLLAAVLLLRRRSSTRNFAVVHFCVNMTLLRVMLQGKGAVGKTLGVWHASRTETAAGAASAGATASTSPV